MVLGIILVLGLITLFFVYVLPTMNTDTVPQNDSLDVNVTLPTNEVTPPTTGNIPPASPNP